MGDGAVAPLIDWENIKYSTIKHLKSPPDIIVLKKIARKYGKLCVARAYANWTDFTHEGDIKRFSLQDIEPVFVETRREKGDNGEETIKNSADIRIACDCIELLFKNSDISTFVLASGDGGFEHIINKIKAYGKRAVPIGIRFSTSGRLGVTADEVIVYDDWISGLKIGVNDPGVSRALTEFVRSVEDIRKDKAHNSLRAVKLRMQKRDPDFEEEKIGIPSFRHLAYLAEMKREVKIDSTTEPARAYLKDETETDEGIKLHSGIKWKAFLEKLEQNIGYKWNILENTVKSSNIYTENNDVKDFIDSVKLSGVLWIQKGRYSTTDRVIPTTEFFLNMNHPKVQVYQTADI